MFRLCSDPEFERMCEGGVRFLFRLDHFRFQDGIDEEGSLSHFVLEDGEEEFSIVQVDQRTMYEILARYLAGEYEKEEYELNVSPGHGALLDILELAIARARNGEEDLVLEELEGFEEEAGEEE